MLDLRLSSRGIAVSTAILLFVFTAGVYAQKAAEWRPIAPADLQATKPVVEPDADAEALIWETRVDDSDDSKLVRKNYVRLKIFTERGREKFSKVDIPFIKGQSKIKDIAARVVKPDGTAIVLAEKDIFEREIVRANGVKLRAKSFAVPNIEPGVIVEYQYRETDDESSFIGGRFYLQKDVPVRELVYYYKPYSGKEPATQMYNATGQGFVKDEHGYYRLSRTNVPAFKEERYMPPDDMVKPFVALQDVSYSLFATNDGDIATLRQDSSNPTKYWGAIASRRALSVKEWQRDADDVKKFTESLIAGAANPEEKLRRIYDFCQKLRNVSYDTSVTDEQMKSITKQRSKDLVKVGPTASARAGQINWLFATMAIAAGFDTRIVYSSRRDEVFFELKMTDSDLISFAGIAVDVGGNFRVFNPGIKYAQFGQLPWYRENAPALVISEKQNGWLLLPMSTNDKNLTKRTAKLTLDETGTLEGTASIELYGQEALSYRLSNWDDEPSKREQNLKDAILARMSGAEISKISIENFDDIAKPIVYRYTIKVPNYAQKTGKRMFFQPGIFEYGSPAKFASATRQYDVAFAYPWSEKDEIELKFPSTYEIDNGEAPGGADAGEISKDVITIGTDRSTSTIKYSRDFYFGNTANLVFNKSAYPAVKELWDMIQKSDSATLSIKQK